jgi:acyl-ACP thioesterase
MYEIQSRVKFSEAPVDGKMTIPAMIHSMQDSVHLHLADIDRGNNYLFRNRRFWIVSGWLMRIYRRPNMGETITSGTYSNGTKSMFGYRNFMIKDVNDQICAKATSLWVFMDMDTRRPVRIKDDDLYGYEAGPDFDDMPKAKHKMALPECTPLEPIPITKCSLDQNGHVNNVSYVVMALEYLPQDFETFELEIVFLKEAAIRGTSFL